MCRILYGDFIKKINTGLTGHSIVRYINKLES